MNSIDSIRAGLLAREFTAEEITRKALTFAERSTLFMNSPTGN